MRHTRHLTIRLAWVAALMLAAAFTARADAPGVALMGYDAVAYFQQHEARPGAGNIALRWRGLIWHFSTVENRAAFEANPRAFVPQFGGMCPEALMNGEALPGDPRYWVIHDGKLYFTRSPEVLARFGDHADGIVPGAVQNWRQMQRQ